MRIQRLLDRPIINADLHRSTGVSIQGPVDDPGARLDRERLGHCHLYFADHMGSYIRPA